MEREPKRKHPKHESQPAGSSNAPPESPSVEAAGKLAEPPAAEPAFVTTRPPSAFQPTKVLRFEDGGRTAVVLGTLAGRPCLVQLEQRATLQDREAVVAAIPALQVDLANHSGAEYSYYEGHLCGSPPPPPHGGEGSGGSEGGSGGSGSSGLGAAYRAGAAYSVEVIWPASERQIQRKSPAEVVLVAESRALYETVVRAHAIDQASRSNGWIDAVCRLEKEKERNLFSGGGFPKNFVVNVDTKWTSHGPLSADPEVRTLWRGADWTSGLYLLAISQDPTLLTMRDLRGEPGASLVDSMRVELLRAAWEVYGVPANQLRVFFHYQPQFYRLHAHCTRIDFVTPGCEVERAHLLATVAENLRLDEKGTYYQKATLHYKVRVGEALHDLLKGAGAIADSSDAGGGQES